MIVCPNCSHTNPEGATQCEACYTALPEMIACPNCGTSIQTDAVFCGQCGYNLEPATVNASPTPAKTEVETSQVSSSPSNEASSEVEEASDLWGEELTNELEEEITALPQNKAKSSDHESNDSSESVQHPIPNPDPLPNALKDVATQLQVQTANLLHVQSQTQIELPHHLSIIHIGKPNENIPPDVDVSGFANSEVVSRIHADIRVEGDMYYLEDTGSSNGTYVNHTPLLQGNRHYLRSGDRISLGKGDLVTFIFQK